MNILTAPTPQSGNTCWAWKLWRIGEQLPNEENSLYLIIQHRAFKTSLGLRAAKGVGNITLDSVMATLSHLICLIMPNRKNKQSFGVTGYFKLSVLPEGLGTQMLPKNPQFVLVLPLGMEALCKLEAKEISCDQVLKRQCVEVWDFLFNLCTRASHSAGGWVQPCLHSRRAAEVKEPLGKKLWFLVFFNPVS